MRGLFFLHCDASSGPNGARLGRPKEHERRQSRAEASQIDLPISVSCRRGQLALRCGEAAVAPAEDDLCQCVCVHLIWAAQKTPALHFSPADTAAPQMHTRNLVPSATELPQTDCRSNAELLQTDCRSTADGLQSSGATTKSGFLSHTQHTRLTHSTSADWPATGQLACPAPSNRRPAPIQPRSTSTAQLRAATWAAVTQPASALPKAHTLLRAPSRTTRPIRQASGSAVCRGSALIELRSRRGRDSLAASGAAA